jgi:hypothetical protein
MIVGNAKEVMREGHTNLKSLPATPQKDFLPSKNIPKDPSMKWVWTQPISGSYHMPTPNLSSRPLTHYKVGASIANKFMKVWLKSSQ